MCSKANYEFYKSHNICVSCGQEDAEKNHTLCLCCMMKNRERSMEYHKKHKEYVLVVEKDIINIIKYIVNIVVQEKMLSIEQNIY